MNHLKYRIAFALVIPVLFCNLTANALFGVAHAWTESGHSSTHKISIFNVVTNDHCPACPDENHQNTDHSHTSCEHHSSLYLANQSLLISYDPDITPHVMREPFKAIPEVYLDKFIPPQNLV